MALSNKAKNYIQKHHSKKSAKEIAEKLNFSEEDVQHYIDEINVPLPLKKKILFYSIIFSIPILFFVTTEMILRSVNYLGDTSLFIDPQIPTEEYLIPNPNFAARYFFYTNTIPNPSTDTFLRKKPANSYRVFAMGESSAAGYPYGYNGTFSRVVDDILSDAIPAQSIEVVNVATSAISSYTLYDQIDEIIEQEPDAIMIYAGHNEFYGALGVGSNENLGAFPGFVRFYLKLQRYKTFLFMRDVMVDSGKWIASFFSSDHDMVDPGATLMERIIKSQSIELNSADYELAMIQFRSNLEAIIEKFSENNIPVYIGTVASNLKDQPPFVSVDSGKLPSAQSVYQEAVNLYEGGNFPEAKEKFEYAKDLDGLKFRAPSQINSIIRELSELHANTQLVSTLEYLEDASTERIIGNNLMLEHLHPNQKGYYLIGRAFAESMLKDLPENELTEGNLNLDSYSQRMYISEFDETVVSHRVKTLKQGFPFVTGEKVSPYQHRYNPDGFIDSLAFMTVHKNKRWDKAKIEIAKFHEKNRDFGQALIEYHGLIRNQPWNDSPYVFAARLYLNENDFDNALPLLEKAYQIEPKEAFTTKMLGAIELNRGNIKKAIQLLEESRAIRSDDPQMLYNLSGAYGKNQDFELALEIADEVIAINPNFPSIQGWKQQLTTIINSRKQN